MISSNVAEPLVQASLLGEAIDQGPVLVFVADEEMKYVAVNQYACDVLGYARDELLRLRVSDVVSSADTQREFADFISEKAAEGQSTLRRKDGGEVRIAWSAKETAIAGMTLYVSVARVV